MEQPQTEYPTEEQIKELLEVHRNGGVKAIKEVLRKRRSDREKQEQLDGMPEQPEQETHQKISNRTA